MTTIIAGVECKTYTIMGPNYYSGKRDPYIIVVAADDLKTVIEQLEARMARLEALLLAHTNRGLPDGVEVGDL